MKIVILVLVVSLSLRSFAGNIDEAVAGKMAVRFYKEQLQNMHKSLPAEINITASFIEKEGKVPVYYIFNINNQGFVMVSACDAAYPVPAWSLESVYHSDNQPPQFLDWTRKYRGQISNAILGKLSASDKVKQSWDDLLSDNFAGNHKNLTSVQPMITTHWDQGQYYNELCPADAAGPGGHALVGCVPVAMGQIMNYYRWPLHGTGSYSYTDSIYGTLSADFNNTNYHWNEMPVALTASNHSLAELLYDLGVSVDLQYGPNGSGMTNHKAAFSLKTYFGYSPLTQYIFRDSTNINWKQTILDHLNAGMPLYYAGWSDTVFQDGHAFVCDGYQDTTYFHFNWGWSGNYDGYFMIDDLTPGANNFTLLHEMIAYIFPEGSYPAFCSEPDTLITPQGTIDDGSGPLNNYQDNSTCSWLIAPDDSLVSITLEFLHFSLDTSDYVIIYNGATENDPVLGIFTGTTLPQNVTATGNRMLVVFISDTTIVSAGFLASYTSVPVIFCHGLVNLTNPEGTIDDGSAGYHYRNNCLCMWQIEPPGATQISLEFEQFDLAEGDILKIYNGSTLLYQLTGDTLPGPFTIGGSSVKLTFKTDISGAAQGFKVHYQAATIGVDIHEIASFECYPNPAGDYLMILSDNTMLLPYTIKLYAADNHYIGQYVIHEKNTRINISQLQSGTYYITGNTPGKPGMKKFVKL
ncbi:MAG: C10 family peptidase [Bacteroidia bacterium]|nr:C10 family peptidase [Bacteroidia bacterium]